MPECIYVFMRTRVRLGHWMLLSYLVFRIYIFTPTHTLKRAHACTCSHTDEEIHSRPHLPHKQIQFLPQLLIILFGWSTGVVITSLNHTFEYCFWLSNVNARQRETTRDIAIAPASAASILLTCWDVGDSHDDETTHPGRGRQVHNGPSCWQLPLAR